MAVGAVSVELGEDLHGMLLRIALDGEAVGLAGTGHLAQDGSALMGADIRFQHAADAYAVFIEGVGLVGH